MATLVYLNSNLTGWMTQVNFMKKNQHKALMHKRFFCPPPHKPSLLSRG